MAMLDYALREASRLKIGVDMATGTGWPFGGPWVEDDTAAKTLVYKTWTLSGGERLTEPVRLRQTPLVRATGNQIHVVNEGAPGDPPRGAAPSAPTLRSETRPIQITDLVEPVTANRNLQALALEQEKYPRDLPLVALIAFSETGMNVDLTARVQAALITSPKTRNVVLTVKTDGGRVNISGILADPDLESEIVRIAKSVAGVTEVITDIEPPPIEYMHP